MLVATLVAVAATLLLSCGESGTDPAAPPPPVATTVSVTPASAALAAIGETVRFTAEVRDQNGQPMAGAPVVWSSSDASVAAVDASGLATAASNGSATITATSGAASGSATVTVEQSASTVVVSPDSAALLVGDTVRLSATVLDALGVEVVGAEVSWSSGDTLVATVDAGGLATGIDAGEVEITAASAGVAGRARLVVAVAAPTTVAVMPDSVSLTALGDTVRLAAEVFDQVGRSMPGAAVAWSSGDSAVATVDSAGLVRAEGSGTVAVTASSGSASGSAAVSVMQSASTVAVTPAEATVGLGDTLRLAAEAFDANGHLVSGAEFSWSSSDPAVATVDGSGMVRGVAEGSATITAATGGAEGTAEITVANPDRAALVALYEATDGSHWFWNDNWLTDAPLAEWYGVETDGTGRVVSLNLAGQWNYETDDLISNGLTGPIPSELGDLGSLRNLRLEHNMLEGPIPADLANLADLEVLRLGDNDLTGSIPAELGDLGNLRHLWLGSNGLTGAIPVQLGGLGKLEHLSLGWSGLEGSIPAELGELSNLRELYLTANKLTGSIPPEIGDLASLRTLDLGLNDLTGPLPQSLLQLKRLEKIAFGDNESVCAPGIVDFLDWLGEIGEFEGPLCNESDADALESLFESAGGSGWTSADGWLAGPALDGWHGVHTDSLGRVTELDLSRNGLAGRLPNQLGDLGQLTELRIEGNPELSGRLPFSLSGVSLQLLHYAGTGLCAPVETSFGNWLSAIPSHEGTGSACEPLSDREILEAFYDATDGPNWLRSDNWLTDASLRHWYGVEVDGHGRVTGLRLWANQLAGSIPPEFGGLARLRELGLGYNRLSLPSELGNLTNLEYLDLGLNDLTGPIPPELGNIEKLHRLNLSRNRLSGPIPGELGNLVKLRALYLESNRLSGPIPGELGNLANLRHLALFENQLSGSIPSGLLRLSDLRVLTLHTNQLSGSLPAALGNLARLEELLLGFNGFAGPIPSELGGLAALRRLYLNNNDLSGNVPSAFAGMANLREFSVTNNAAMTGALPSSLSSLAALEALFADGTALCAPSDDGFQTWLAGVGKRRIPTCGRDAPVAHLTQAVQSREFPVPLIAGREALLRVFPTAGSATGAGIPGVRARFYRNGREIHSADILGKSTPIPTEVEEGDLSKSANAEVPGLVVQPGLEMVIEVDPDGTLDPALGVVRRIPESGRLPVDVRDLPAFDLTVIPFVWSETGDSSIVDLVGAMAADPENHEMFRDVRALLPVGDMDVKAHEPVLTSANHTEDLTRETVAIRAMEGGMAYYMGMMSEPITGAGGNADRSKLSNFSRAYPHIIAHEIGHTFSLLHVPCGDPANSDPGFPHPGGSIGVWGYDSRAGGLVHPSIPDVMSYCHNPHWISDFSFTTAMHFRLSTESGSGARASQQAPAEALLLWGGVDSEGDPFLEPSFVIDAPAALPLSAGDYRLVGRTRDGAELFSLSFDMSELTDGDGSSSFTFVLPVRAHWKGSLASVTLSGPAGSVSLDGESDHPMAILRNSRTGQIRGILRDLPAITLARVDAASATALTGTDAAAALSVDPGLDVLFSRGVPGAEELPSSCGIEPFNPFS